MYCSQIFLTCGKLLSGLLDVRLSFIKKKIILNYELRLFYIKYLRKIHKTDYSPMVISLSVFKMQIQISIFFDKIMIGFQVFIESFKILGSEFPVNPSQIHIVPEVI